MNNAIRLFFKQSGQLSMEVVILPELGKTCAQRGGEKKKNGEITAQLAGRQRMCYCSL